MGGPVEMARRLAARHRAAGRAVEEASVYRNLQRWAAGRYAAPAHIWPELADELRRQRAHIGELLRKLPR